MAENPQVIIIGSGPNGLTAAAKLASAGISVVVLEANPARLGGALGSEAATLPGFIHDVGAGFFPWAHLSPAFSALVLERYGLSWRHAAFESCHPAPDGSYAAIARNLDVTAKHFGTPEDGESFRNLAQFYQRAEPDLLKLLMEPLPGAWRPALRLFPGDLTRIARIFMSSGSGLSRRLFRSEAARRVLPGLALHVDAGPADGFSAALGFMLGMTAVTGGYAVPVGGAQMLADALVACVRGHGGEVRRDARVVEVCVREGQAYGVRLANGEIIDGAKAVLADTDVGKLFLQLVPREFVPMAVLDRLETYPRGFATFKMDWALNQAVPWTVEIARQSAVVHSGDGLEDLEDFTAQIRRGELPTNPYLVIGQQSLADSSRAPRGCHTLWAYSRLPMGIDWSKHREFFADRIEQRIERLAPGFRASILARRIRTPDDLEIENANLVGGDLGGGSNAWYRQLIFRPFFPYFNYRMPVRGLYLCSSYAHPGAGVHGMAGWNAAKICLQDLESERI